MPRRRIRQIRTTLPPPFAAGASGGCWTAAVGNFPGNKTDHTDRPPRAIPYTALPATNPVLALDLIDQCREAGFGVLTVGFLLSFVGDVVVKYDHVEI